MFSRNVFLIIDHVIKITLVAISRNFCVATATVFLKILPVEITMSLVATYLTHHVLWDSFVVVVIVLTL